MGSEQGTDPWADAPDGTLAPFLERPERNRLISDKTVVGIHSVTIEQTAYGNKWYVTISLPDNSARCCTFKIEERELPRDRTLQHLKTWLAKNEGEHVPAILVPAGNGYIFAAPPGWENRDSTEGS